MLAPRPHRALANRVLRRSYWICERTELSPADAAITMRLGHRAQLRPLGGCCRPSTRTTSARWLAALPTTTGVRSACIVRGFVGNDHVRQNWTGLFRRVPDIEARVLRSVEDGDTLWSEWEMTGTTIDDDFRVRGVAILGSRTVSSPGRALPRPGRRRTDRCVWVGHRR